MTDTHSASGTDHCPVCGETFNHRVGNGFRNYWPTGVKFEICTPEDSDNVYVHTQELLIDRENSNLARNDRSVETDTDHGVLDS